MACENGINIPQLNTDVCHGESKDDKCVIHTDAITSLGLPPNSSVYSIVNAFTAALVAVNNRLSNLDATVADLEARIVVLETP